jgi:putative regulator of septum formation
MTEPHFPEYARRPEPPPPAQNQWPYTVPQQPPVYAYDYHPPRRQPPSQLAIAAFAVSALAFGAFVVLMFGIAMNWDNEPLAGPDDPAPVVAPTQAAADDEGYDAYVDEVAEGDCFDESEDSEYDLYVVPCDVPHTGEAIAAVVLPPGKYPGDRALADTAEKSCDTEFASYVGVSVYDTELSPDFYYPSKSTWDDGDRTVLCVAWAPEDEDLTGSVRGSKR